KGYDSEDEQDPLVKALGTNTKIVVPFFRGVHFFSNKFTSEDRAKFLREKQVGKPIFSQAATKMIPAEDLVTNSKTVRKEVAALNNGERGNKNPYNILHQVYVNTYDNFQGYLTQHTPFKGNPIISTSE